MAFYSTLKEGFVECPRHKHLGWPLKQQKGNTICLQSIIEAIRLYYGCWTKGPEVNEPRSTSHTHTHTHTVTSYKWHKLRAGKVPMDGPMESGRVPTCMEGGRYLWRWEGAYEGGRVPMVSHLYTSYLHSNLTCHASFPPPPSPLALPLPLPSTLHPPPFPLSLPPLDNCSDVYLSLQFN